MTTRSARGKRPQPVQARARRRREKIIEVAAELMLERGYHGVSIDDIGEAAGVSGPAIYHYFEGKNDLLVALFEELEQQMLSERSSLRVEALPPHELFRQLVTSHTSLAISERTRLAVYFQEERELPEPVRARFGRRTRDLQDLWTRTVRRIRPDLGESEAEVLTEFVFWGVLTAARYDVDRDPDELRETLSVTALEVVSSFPPQLGFAGNRRAAIGRSS